MDENTNPIVEKENLLKLKKKIGLGPVIHQYMHKNTYVLLQAGSKKLLNE